MKGSVLYSVHAGALKGLIVLILIVLACTTIVAGDGQSFDAAPGTILRLTDDLDTQEKPAIDGDYIVWNHVSDENPAIVVYNITTGGKTEIPVHDDGRRQSPRISR
ncbi:MAG: hypothetical protein KAW93_07840 [Methanogenium sp.]|nr:hypothetical protein [Methanogenium sp.]